MILLDDLVAATGGRLLMPGARAAFPGFAHDSRQVAPGECFVAVRGPHRDGHEYAADAVERGAGALLVETAWLSALEAAPSELRTRLESSGAVVVAVPDTRLALQGYATHVLRAWKPVVIAVTGSTGKTTTKEAIADVLGLIGPTFRSWRNYNDLLGLPLSLGALEPAHAYAVVEMACDHPGEIRALCAVAGPSVGVVTNVSPTQLQYFGNPGALAAELNQLPRALPSAGFAVLNASDPAARAMGSDTEATVRFFGPLPAGTPPDQIDPRHPLRYALIPIGATAPVPRPAPGMNDHRVGRRGALGGARGALKGGARGALKGAANPAGRETVGTALTLRPLDADDGAGADLTFRHLHGDHWADAVLAALTVGNALGVDPDAAAQALIELQPLPGRLNWLAGRDGLALLDDSHNAAPASVRAGLAALAAVARAHAPAAPRVAVLGDMLRLGDAEERAHREVGRQAAACATHLVTLGPRAEVIADGARRAGLAPEHIAVTRTHEDAARAALDLARAAARPPAADADSPASADAAPPAGFVLVKGSEEMRLEQVVARLLAQPERAEELLDRQSPLWQRVVMMRPDRPTWLEVDLSTIGRNTRLVKRLVGPGVEVLASLKADAYGHGALGVARTVLRNGARWLGVATVSEAAPLRAAGIAAPILVFGYTAPWQAREAVRLDLRTAVYDAALAGALSRAAVDLGGTVRVHVKVDTGMGRLGLRADDPDAVVAFFEGLRALPGLVVEGVFTHLATADDADQRYARRQIARFERVLAVLAARGMRPPVVHAANSATLLALPETRYDLVRPGIALYGLAPSADVRLPEGFRPALAFKTQVAQVKDVPAGEGISYGATFVTPAPMRIATLPVGYADGFRRAPANWGEVLVRGRRAPLLGRVCMDQCMIDVTQIPGVRIGDEVVLIGRQGDDELTAEAVAKRLGTIHYEVVAALLARVPRVS